MQHIYPLWKLMIGAEVLRPKELAIVFGLMDSPEQAFSADKDTTQQAMKSFLGSTNLVLYFAAGRDPILLPWVMAGVSHNYL
jgi:hypothetical protein